MQENNQDPGLDDFRDRVKSLQEGGTREIRLQDIGSFERFLSERGLDPLDVNVGDAEDFVIWLDGENYAPKTINNRRKTIKKFYDFLIKRTEIEENPFTQVNWNEHANLIKGTRQKKYIEGRGDIYALEPEGVDNLANNVGEPKTRNELIVRLMYHTGVRRQELADMKLENHDPDERKIEVHSSKLDSEYHENADPWRPVWYGPSLDRLMTKWIDIERPSYITADSPYIFIGHQSDHLSGEAINDVVKNAAENAGIQDPMYEDRQGRTRYLITSHVLRHSFARECISPDENGARIDLKTLAGLLGHQSTDHTEKYLMFAEDDYRRARELYGPR